MSQSSGGGSDPDSSSDHDHATAPPYLLFSLLPLPCVPVSLRRSRWLDLALSTLVLFVAFLLHDGLQETLYHTLRLRTPVFITSLDFMGCAVWGGIVMRFMSAGSAPAAAADKSTGAAGARSSSSPSATSRGSPVQIELVHVQDKQDGDSDLSARVRGGRSGVHSTSSSEHGAGAVAVAPSSFASSSPARIPYLHAFAIGSMILLSNFLGIYSLSFVDYPLKVVIRSSKLIPTMIIGRLVLRKRYGAMHYLAACMLCLGVILFSLADVQPVHNAASGVTAAGLESPTAAAAAAAAAAGVRRLLDVSSTSDVPASALPLELTAASDSVASVRSSDSLVFIGVALLAFSVLVDAINPNIAELFINKPVRGVAHAASPVDGARDIEGAPLLRSNAGPAAPSSHGHGGASDPHSVNRFMFHTNAAVLPLLLVVLLLSDELPLLVARVLATPSVLLLFVLYSTCSYMGVNAYTSMIKKHGSVLTVGLATLRKVCTIVLSYLFIDGGAGSAAPAVAPVSLTHPLDPVVVAVPEKHFGARHLLPSALILCGLLLSAWIERGKHAAAASNAGAGASSASASASGANRSQRSTSAFAHAPSAASTGAVAMGSSSSAGASSSSHDELRLLAAELGLETEGETECDTDAEQGNERATKAQAQHAAAASFARGTMAKHAPRILLDDDDFI